MRKGSRRVTERRCRACGTGSIKPLARPGRRARYKTIVALEVPGDVAIPTCDRCGTEWLTESTARELDAALERAYRRVLHDQARRAIDLLAAHATMRRLEQLLGLSHGYLSKIRAGDRVPSPELVGHLALLARDPRRRLRELEELWEHAA
jgi:hypothetical protein